jgi:hypothetical protein
MIEMRVEIREPVLRIEAHGFFEVPRHSPFISGQTAKNKPPRLRGLAAVPKLGP